MHPLKNFTKYSVEGIAAFRDKANRLPRIGPEELHRFIDPPLIVWSQKYNPTYIFTSSSAHIFAPILYTSDGPYLRRNTWLNDSIITAYASVCNALTEDNLNCLFLGPESSNKWKEEDVFYKNEHHRKYQKQLEEQQEAKRLGKKLKGNIGRRLLSNRIMSIHEIFEKGYKSAYWVFNRQ